MPLGLDVLERPARRLRLRGYVAFGQREAHTAHRQNHVPAIDGVVEPRLLVEHRDPPVRDEATDSGAELFTVDGIDQPAAPSAR